MLGFFVGHGHLLGLIANNIADAWLHVAVSAVSLFLGFGPLAVTRTANRG